MSRAFIGLGSNLGEPQQQLINALHALHRLPGSRLLQHSRLYRSAPIGPQDQPDFINAVAELETRLSPIDLLHSLQALELAAGRQRLRHWGERSLDLDILLIDQLSLDLAELQLPHPQLSQRAFVLQPLLELLPADTLINGEHLGRLQQQLPEQALQPLDSLATNQLLSGATATGQEPQPGLL